MSMEQVEVFFKKVANDEALRQQLKRLAEEKQGDELLKAICEVGMEHGGAFTVDDLAPFCQRFVAGSGELNDAELEQMNAAGLGEWFDSILRSISDWYLRYHDDDD